MGLTIFAQRLKQIRESKGLKQNELAKKVGVTPNTISSYERADTEGNGKKPTLENAQAIADTLDVSLDWLCGRTDNESVSFTDFTANDYLKSIVTILLETSCSVSDNKIEIDNKDILQFITKVNTLIQAYRTASISEDLFDVCINKILSDYADYTIIANCFLNDQEVKDANIFLDDYLVGNPDVSVGIYSATVSKTNGLNDKRKVKLAVSQSLIDKWGTHWGPTEKKDR